jgi:hypothetical protein
VTSQKSLPLISTMPFTVELISAAWCKRCHAIKPEVAQLCAAVGAIMTVRDYDDDLEEDERGAIVSLPTIRMRSEEGEGWRIWTAATLDDWKAVIATAGLRIRDDDTDF